MTTSIKILLVTILILACGMFLTSSKPAEAAPINLLNAKSSRDVCTYCIQQGLAIYNSCRGNGGSDNDCTAQMVGYECLCGATYGCGDLIIIMCGPEETK